MRDLMAYRSGDPFAGGSHASLVARGTEVAGFTGEGEQPLMAAIGAFEAGESGGEVAAAEKGFDGCDGGRVDRTQCRTVLLLVIGKERSPAVIDELPKGRGAGTSRLVNGWHKDCSYEQSLCGARMGVMDRFS